MSQKTKSMNMADREKVKCLEIKQMLMKEVKRPCPSTSTKIGSPNSEWSTFKQTQVAIGQVKARQKKKF